MQLVRIYVSMIEFLYHLQIVKMRKRLVLSFLLVHCSKLSHFKGVSLLIVLNGYFFSFAEKQQRKSRKMI